MKNAGKVFWGSDHAGVEAKRLCLEKLKAEFPDCAFEDLGPQSTDSVDYPAYAETVAKAVLQDPKHRGILICGSGIGMSMSANKHKGIRAALAWDTTSARLSREHNDANILCLGSRLVGQEVMLDAIRVWLKTEFAGGRHQKRVDQMNRLI